MAQAGPSYTAYAPPPPALQLPNIPNIPLPAGWTEHLAPNGVPYYHHATSSNSSWVRPENPHALNGHKLLKPKSKKLKSKPKAEKADGDEEERPVHKTRLGDGWYRVRTNRGNVFFRHASKGVSTWDVPEEVREVLERLERTEQEGRTAKRKVRTEPELGEEGVRKKAKVVVEEERDADAPAPTVEKEEEEEEEEEERDEAEEREAREETERWRVAAEAEAARAAAETKALQAADQRKREEAAAAASALPNVSPEEARALFRSLLQELDISPLMPFEDALPLLVPDRRYALLPSAADRLEVFNDYCRTVARARSARNVSGSGNSPKLSPEEEYMKLLREDVMSTRTSWTDWRRRWKKERRFWGWGTEREREGRFREWLRVLGERKRGEREGAERAFGEMLREGGVEGGSWAEVKRGFARDPRYDAVGSSSRREELFNNYLASLRAPAPAPAAGEKHESKLERQQRALRERESHVREGLRRAEREAEASRSLLGAEEGEREFGSLLVDAVRELDISWDQALSTLRPDPRFTRSRLGQARQRTMFDLHLAALRRKHVNALETLFEAHAPELSTPFSALPAGLVTSLPATKLGLSPRSLEREYELWQERRRAAAREAFDEMLRENSFVTFWGRARKLAQRADSDASGGLAQGVLEETAAYGDEEEFVSEEADGAGGLGRRAAEVGLGEVEMVLKGDKRWRAWEWKREEREGWLKDWLEGIKAPGRSVHTGEV
ncbi:hypothetical protein CALVIDRAFT_542992 [Calocera viscosa TUFC12733]|uniref:WW domain-containing protein n=1 Tax=Calocera viscosa (strain TUFC12733) TaxID=1330018 RepID=A0A167G1Y1_CALVF|nr:hypothetical protein CALVIDRAFT_542992 [Calocera viscosa TUFC12733]